MSLMEWSRQFEGLPNGMVCRTMGKGHLVTRLRLVRLSMSIPTRVYENKIDVCACM